MVITRILGFMLGSLPLLISCSSRSTPTREAHTALLQEIHDSYWSYVFENNVEHRIKYGADIVRLPDLSLAKAREQSDVAKRHLERLTGVNGELLSHDDWVTLEVLRWDLRLEAEREQHYWLNIPITPRMVRNTYVPEMFEDYSFEELADLSAYLDLLSQFPAYAVAVREKLLGQLERGIVSPQAEIQLLLPIWQHLQAPGEESPFFVSNARLTSLRTDHPDAVISFQAKVRSLIDGEIQLSLRQLMTELTGNYSRNAPERIGFGHYPGGAAYYDFTARFFATLKISPRAVHDQGLEQVEAINAEMDALRLTLGFQGDREAFHHFLKTDPQFLATTPDEVAEILQSHLDGIKPRLADFFSRLPRAPYRLKRLPAEYEGGLTYGFYNPPSGTDPAGYFLYNGSRLDQRSMIFSRPLIYHELMPGHHLQVNHQWENKGLPIYRQNAFYSAYSEGWGVYASQLARQMSMYDDPYIVYARLAADLLYATRLVVDTGLNVLDWSQQRTLAFMRENTLHSETQLNSEILRYGADAPGQALAYKIGNNKIWELRLRAEKALGERFDIRRFHDALLDYGPMPLEVLEAHIDWFIEQEGI